MEKHTGRRPRITAPAYLAFTGQKSLEYRLSRGMNQSVFWARLGVTQSGGSRYESGRALPPPITRLLALSEGTVAQQIATLNDLGVNLAKLHKEIGVRLEKEARQKASDLKEEVASLEETIKAIEATASAAPA